MITKIIKDILLDTDLYAAISDDDIETIAHIYAEIISDSLEEVNSELFENFSKKVAEEVGYGNDINWVDVGYAIFEEM